MYKDISQLARKVPDDDLTTFIDNMKIAIKGFGSWTETDIRSINNFIVPDYEIIYNFKGVSKLVKNGREFVCPAGSLVLFEPFTSYSAKCCGEEKSMYFYMHFELAQPYGEIFHKLMFEHDDSPLFTSSSFEALGMMLEALASSEQRALPGHKSILKLALTRAII